MREETQQSTENVGFPPSTQPTQVLVFDFNPSVLIYKQLLEIAKIGVERAIETDEAIATTWINQQLKALNIEIDVLK